MIIKIILLSLCLAIIFTGLINYQKITVTINFNITKILFIVLLSVLIIIIYTIVFSPYSSTDKQYIAPKFNGDKVIPGKFM